MYLDYPKTLHAVATSIFLLLTGFCPLIAKDTISLQEYFIYKNLITTINQEHKTAHQLIAREREIDSPCAQFSVKAIEDHLYPNSIFLSNALATLPIPNPKLAIIHDHYRNAANWNLLFLEKVKEFTVGKCLKQTLLKDALALRAKGKKEYSEYLIKIQSLEIYYEKIYTP